MPGFGCCPFPAFRASIPGLMISVPLCEAKLYKMGVTQVLPTWGAFPTFGGVQGEQGVAQPLSWAWMEPIPGLDCGALPSCTPWALAQPLLQF